MITSHSSQSIAMTFNFPDNTNPLTSSAITLSVNQSVTPDLRGNRFVSTQSIPSARPYGLGNTLPPHACSPFDHQIFTMGTLVHRTGKSSLAAAYHPMPVYKVGNNHTFTGMYNPQPQPPFSNVSINNEQPSYYSYNSEVDDIIQQSPKMAAEGPISADYYPMLASKNTNSLTIFADNFGGIAQGIRESDLSAAANNLMPVYAISHNSPSTYNAEHRPLFSGVFMNDVQPSPLMTQQTRSHGYNGQGEHLGNLTVGKAQQSPTMAVEITPTSANYYLASDGNTNMYSRVSHGNTAHWRCNISGCQYVSRFKRDIKRHCSKLRHGGSREHECGFCGKAFSRRDIIKRHVKATRCWLRQVVNTA